VTTAELVEADMQSARILLGPLRVFPMIVVDNAGYDNNVFSTPEGFPKFADWTATAGAGGRVVLPMGSKFFLRLTAVPQYIWYDKLADRRTWGGDFSGQFLALGNRLSFEADGGLTRGYTVVNSELGQQALETQSSAGGKLEVDLTRSLSFVALGGFSDLRFTNDLSINPIGVDQFNRQDSAVMGGLRFKVLSYLDLTAGVQGTRSDFDEHPELRNNETYAVLGGIHLDRSRLFVNLAGGYRKGRPFEGSLFRTYATSVGSYFVSFKVVDPLEIQATGHRQPVYSLSSFDQLFVESRYGGGLVVHIGPLVALHGYAEKGTNAYPFPNPPTDPRRIDDAVSYGGSASVLLFRTITIRAQANQDNLKRADGTNRNVFRFTTGLSFNEEYRRQ
jgi:hypothetical protein